MRDWCGTTTLLICVYLPHNDGSSASHNEYLIALGELGFINRHTSDHLLIAGDFNVDFCHASMTLQHLRSFITDLNLVSADLPFHSSIGFTYMRDDSSASPGLTTSFVILLLLLISLSSAVWTLVPIFLITHF